MQENPGIQELLARTAGMNTHAVCEAQHFGQKEQEKRVEDKCDKYLKSSESR